VTTNAALRRPTHWRGSWEAGDPSLSEALHRSRGLQAPTPIPGQRGFRASCLTEHGSIHAVAESFFATLKNELVHRGRWANRAELRAAVFEYVEVSTIDVDFARPSTTRPPPRSNRSTPRRHNPCHVTLLFGGQSATRRVASFPAWLRASRRGRRSAALRKTRSILIRRQSPERAAPRKTRSILIRRQAPLRAPRSDSEEGATLIRRRCPARTHRRRAREHPAPGADAREAATCSCSRPLRSDRRG
jgi:hypothetical protein